MFREYIAQVLKNSKTMAAALISKGYTLVSGKLACISSFLPLKEDIDSAKSRETMKTLIKYTVQKMKIKIDTAEERKVFKFMGCKWLNASVAALSLNKESVENGSFFPRNKCFNLV